MKLMKNFYADLYLNSILELTPDMLIERNIKGLILDIDNTLVTYDDPEPTEEVLAWLSAMEAAGIKAAFVSNNESPARVDVFNRELGLYATSRSKKPLPVGFRRAMRALGVKPCECLAVGDQIFTDVWGGKNAGAKAFLVPPIKDRTDWFFRLKRKLEAPIIRRYKKKNGK